MANSVSGELSALAGHLYEVFTAMKMYKAFAIRPSLNREKAEILLTSIVMSNLSYCPLIWMFCSESANKEINRTNKHALRVLFNHAIV